MPRRLEFRQLLPTRAGSGLRERQKEQKVRKAGSARQGGLRNNGNCSACCRQTWAVKIELKHAGGCRLCQLTNAAKTSDDESRWNVEDPVSQCPQTPDTSISTNEQLLDLLRFGCGCSWFAQGWFRVRAEVGQKIFMICEEMHHHARLRGRK